jgi:hypothetical protein
VAGNLDTSATPTHKLGVILQLIFLQLPYISSTVFVTFVNLFYILFIAPSPLPLDTLGGLA